MNYITKDMIIAKLEAHLASIVPETSLGSDFSFQCLLAVAEDFQMMSPEEIHSYIRRDVAARQVYVKITGGRYEGLIGTVAMIDRRRWDSPNSRVRVDITNTFDQVTVASGFLTKITFKEHDYLKSAGGSELYSEPAHV